MPYSLRRIRCFLTMLLCLTPGLAGWAQAAPEPVPHPQQQIVVGPFQSGSTALDGPWMMRAGDDAAFAGRSFDDSAWSSVWLGTSNALQEQPQASVLWYRATIQQSNAFPAQALLIDVKAEACQVFLNGEQVADCRGFGAPDLSFSRGIFVPLTTAELRAPMILAIRLDHPGAFRQGGIGLAKGEVLTGTRAALLDHRSAIDARRFYDTLPQTLLCCAEFFVGALILSIFFQNRKRHEYLWFAVFLFLDGIGSQMSVFDRVYPLLGAGWQAWLNNFGLICRYVPLISFLAAFTGVRVNRFLRAYQIFLLLVPELLIPLESIEAILPKGNLVAVFLSLQIPFIIGSILFLVVQARRGNREAILLLPSFLLANGFEVIGLVVWGDFRFHLGPRFAYDYDDLSMFFFLISIGPIIAFRHHRDSREHVRASAELDAAREMQQRLVPTNLPATPGCHIEAAYLPAAEVGGDFYQVIQQANDATLVVLGDVSGKGLKAAMTGAVAIGVIRSLAAENHSPAALMDRLNRQMVTAGNGGFITCLCVHISSLGLVTLANAGHLAPYRNSINAPTEEVESEAALPLGLWLDATYSESTLQLNPGETLTLLTDGVLEATTTTGDLFGFERTAAISNQTAEAIAKSAQIWGQDDDITVLTLTRLIEAVHA